MVVVGLLVLIVTFVDGKNFLHYAKFLPTHRRFTLNRYTKTGILAAAVSPDLSLEMH